MNYAFYKSPSSVTSFFPTILSYVFDIYMKILKVLLWLCIISILLGVIAAFAVIKMINPNNFKQQISAQVQTSTGRKLDLKGDIGWSLFPWLGLQINDATLSNPPNFDQGAFAHINQAKVAVKLLPLFDHKVLIDSIKLDGIDINLVKNNKGVGNWEGFVDDNSTQQQAKTKDKAIPSKQDLTFSVNAIDITNSRVSWNDKQTKKNIEVNNFEFHGKDFAENKAIPLQVQFNVKDADMSGPIQITGLLIVNSQQDIDQFQQLKLTAQLKGASLPNQQLNLALLGDATINGAQNTAQGNVHADNLQVGDFKADNVNTKFTLRPGSIAFNPITAQMYQGNYNGNIFIITRGKEARSVSYSELKNIQVAPLLHDLGHITYLKVTGTGNITAKLSAQGNAAKAILKDIDGQGTFALNNGILEGINIPYWIDAGQSILRKQLPSLPSFPQQTAFGNLTGSFTLNNGVVENNDLLLLGPNLRANGKGSADLTAQKINYVLNAQLLDRDTSDVKGSIIPIKITGSFDHPNIQPKIDDIIKSQLKVQYEKNKEKVGEQLKKYLGDDTGSKIQQGLESLLK